MSMISRPVLRLAAVVGKKEIVRTATRTMSTCPDDFAKAIPMRRVPKDIDHFHATDIVAAKDIKENGVKRNFFYGRDIDTCLSHKIHGPVVIVKFRLAQDAVSKPGKFNSSASYLTPETAKEAGFEVVDIISIPLGATHYNL